MERKWSRENKSKALQGTNQTPQGEAVCQQANQAEDAP